MISYLYNDLATMKPLSAFSGTADTVLLADGSLLKINAGHSALCDADLIPDTNLNRATGVVTGGANVLYLRLSALRHTDGANFLMADGHSKWFKVHSRKEDYRKQPVYFPSDQNLNDAHTSESGAPDPGGNMGRWSATFHIR